MFVLSKFEEFMITLTKLRLSLFNEDLGYRFEIHQSTISRIFHRWIDVMLIQLKPLNGQIENREEPQKSMPMDFRLNFKKCAVIIDCFEIFYERPYPLKARAVMTQLSISVLRSLIKVNKCLVAAMCVLAQSIDLTKFVITWRFQQKPPFNFFLNNVFFSSCHTKSIC